MQATFPQRISSNSISGKKVKSDFDEWDQSGKPVPKDLFAFDPKAIAENTGFTSDG